PIRSHAVPLLWRRRQRPELDVATGDLRDLGEMAALWRRLSPARNFAPVYTPDSLAGWIQAAPGLALDCYRLARRRDGRLAGFLGLWDQAAFKQLRVLRYSRRARAVRSLCNGGAPLCGAASLPVAGSPLRYVTAVHVCAEDPVVLRALLLHAYDALRGRGYAFFTIGLDTRDPLAEALTGLLAQPTDVHAYVTTPAGRYAGAPLDRRPLHYEIALVRGIPWLPRLLALEAWLAPRGDLRPPWFGAGAGSRSRGSRQGPSSCPPPGAWSGHSTSRLALGAANRPWSSRSWCGGSRRRSPSSRCSS